MTVILQLNEAQLATLEETLNADGSKEADELHLEIASQLDDQRFMLSWDEGDDEPDLETALWATFDWHNLLRAPTEIGYGSGEELWEALQPPNGDFSQGEATTLLDLLNRIRPTGDDDATT